MSSPVPSRGRVHPLLAATCDVVALFVFVAVGRSSHDEGQTITGLATTAWPFLVGAAVGWPSPRS